jgi:N-acetylglucosamine-6-sulfatase
MRARRRLAVILLLGVPVAACGGGDDPGAADQERPNVVVLMTDDQTLESMRVMPGVRRALAAQGTTFTRSFTSFAVCCPSRATFLTGQYAHNHGVLSNRPPEGGYRRLDRHETLPVWLRRAGYRTMHVGKFLNRYGQHLGPHHVPPGWDEWHGSIDPSTYRYYGYTLNENGELVTYRRAYSTDLYAARAIELIEDAAEDDEPFFLNVGFLAPHAGAPRDADDLRGLATPSPAARHRDRFAQEPLPPGVRAAFDEADISDKPAYMRARPRLGDRRAVIRENYRQRLESLLAADEAVVDIVEALREEDELDDTLVIFTSDNGFFHGEHRMPSEKMLVYEQAIRVPLIMRGPGVPRGERRGQLVTNADLSPTILAVTGASAAKRQDGRSLLPLLADRGLEWGRDLLIEGMDGYSVVGYEALRTYRYLYARYRTGERELYDLERDPHQLTSVHADPAYAGVRAQLARRLASLATCAGRSCGARPALRLSASGCRVHVTGPGIERVSFRSERRRSDSRPPFAAVAAGSSVRARVSTADGRVASLDRPLPACG